MGQMLLVIGSLVMLSFVSLSSKAMLIDRTIVMLEAEAQMNGISIAQSLIDEIQTKSYDATTVTAIVYNASNLTPTGGLGPSGSEAFAVPQPDRTQSGSYPYKSIKGFNDVDDYNHYRRIVVTPRMGDFTVLSAVEYASESDPDATSSAQTFFKRITVSVSHPNMLHPLELSDIVVYRQYF